MSSDKIETRNNPEEVSKKNIIKSLIAVGAALLLVGLIWLVYFLMHNNDNSKKVTTESNNDTGTSQPAVKHGATGKSLEQDQKDAMQAATTLLNNAAKSPTKETAQKRISELDNDNYNVVDKSVVNGMQFTPNSSNGMKSSAYQSLISINTIISSKTGKTTLTPLNADSYKEVYVDQQAGTAFVPLDVYLSNANSSTFNLEMININNKWLFAPYSLINEVKISALLNNTSSKQSSNSSASPTATK